MSMIKAFAWTLENTQPGHNKFYTVVIVETGVTVLNWGRIGATGQFKVHQLPFADADSTGKRQVYEKAAKGYDFIVNGLKFKIDAQLVLDAVATQQPQRITQAFEDARASGTELVAVLDHYDDLEAQANNLVQRAAAGEGTDVLLDEWTRLQRAWDAIKDRHSMTKTNMEFAGSMLQQALLSTRSGS